MTTDIKHIAVKMGQKWANADNKVIRREHLTADDYRMFDAIFERIEYEKKYPPKPVLTPHFSLQVGWKPNRKTVSSQSRSSDSRKEHSKSRLPSLRALGKL